jgi:DNA-binding NarL/FixJ family response regulator
MAGAIRVLVGEPLRLYSEALALALDQSPEIAVIADRPTNGPHLIEKVEKFRPDVVLMDYFMPDMDGPSLTRTVSVTAPSCKILVLSWLSSAHLIQEALQAGASGFLMKDCSISQLTEAISRAHKDEQPVFAGILQQQVALVTSRQRAKQEIRNRFEGLTPREVEILALLQAGRSTKQISHRLAVSLGTVRNHISAILTKSGTNSQIEAVAMARETGFLSK